jgi:DnaJ-class molecular chaperone
MEKEKEEVKMETCPTCNGKKEVMISCCTQEVIHDDSDFCPKCFEHMGLEECPDCEGTGKVPEGKTDLHETANGVYSRAEFMADQAQDR